MLANSKKRVLSLFLAFVMVFGLLPTAAFAAANDGQIGKYVELNADNTIPVSYTHLTLPTKA